MIDDLLKSIGINTDELRKFGPEKIDLEDIFPKEYETKNVTVIAVSKLGSKVIKRFKDKKSKNVTFIDMKLNENAELLNETELVIFIGEEDDREGLVNIQRAIESAVSRNIKTILLMSVSDNFDKEAINLEMRKLIKRTNIFIPVIDKEVNNYDYNVFGDLDKKTLKENLMKSYLEVILDFTPECTGIIEPIDIVEVASKYMGTAYVAMATASGKDRAKKAANLVLKNVYSLKNYQDSKVFIFNVTGDTNLELLEVNDVAEIIAEKVGDKAEILFAATIDDSMRDEIKISAMGI